MAGEVTGPREESAIIIFLINNAVILLKYSCLCPMIWDAFNLDQSIREAFLFKLAEVNTAMEKWPTF